MKQSAGAIALTCAALFLVATVVGGVDDWPFTSAPMYSTYVSRETPLYRFRMEGEKNGVVARHRLKMRGLGLEAEEFTFLYRFYVPYTWRLPRRHGFDDTPAQFEARMADYFRIQRKRNRGGPARISLYVDRYQGGARIASHRVGTYDAAAGAFTLAPRDTAVGASAVDPPRDAPTERGTDDADETRAP